MAASKTDLDKILAGPASDMLKTVEAINKMSMLKSFDFPDMDHYRLPEIEMPTQEEINSYQSASALMKSVADAATSWKNQLPENHQPAVMAIMYGGLQIQVKSLAQVSFHGIRIQGTLSGAQCTMLAHQSTVQILCYAQEITAETPKNAIGFIWPDHKVEV